MESNESNITPAFFRKNIWEKKKVLELIEDFRLRPVLWQIRQNQNSLKVRKALEELAKKYNVIPEEINAKFQILKSQFRREDRKIKMLKSTDAPITNMWFGYKKLLFLKETLCAQPPKKTANAKLNSSKDVILGLPIDNEQETMKEQYIISSIDDEYEESDNETVSRYRCSMVHNNSIQMIAQYLGNRDEFSIYGEHVANKLRNCGKSDVAISKAQHDVNKILLKLLSTDYYDTNENVEDETQTDK